MLSTPSIRFRHVVGRFTFVHLHDKHLTGVRRPFPCAFTTTALNGSSPRWFATSVWTAVARGLPSSLVKFTSPLCAQFRRILKKFHGTTGARTGHFMAQPQRGRNIERIEAHRTSFPILNPSGKISFVAISGKPGRISSFVISAFDHNISAILFEMIHSRPSSIVNISPPSNTRPAEKIYCKIVNRSIRRPIRLAQ